MTTQAPEPKDSLARLALRGSFGGLLMGLANLVPGISGGTMLLAAGVYRGFVDGIARVSTLRFRRHDLVLLVSIVATSLVAILLFAGPIKELVIHQRWVMFSLFIGLTLGGVPIVWNMARPATPALWTGVAAGFALMLGVALSGGLDQGAGSGYGMSVAAGVAGASAMILPGISGSYLLLLMGQYLPILDAVDTLKLGLGARDFAMISQSMHVVIPVGLGVVVGVVGLSNVLKRLLEQRPQPTLGFLLGLLFGSVLGLWPFEQTVDVLPLGESLKGVVITAENLAELTRTVDREDWPSVSYVPGVLRIILATAIAAFGYALTWLIARFGIGRT
jgi:putative membrane protein